MLYYFAALTAAGAAAWLARPQEAVNRWAAIFMLTAASGGLTEQLRQRGLSGFAEAAGLFNACLTPYAVLIFCLLYGGFLPSSRQRTAAKLLLLAPPAASAAGAWLLAPAHAPNYGMLLVWAGPYYAAACACLLVSLHRERHAASRRSRLALTAVMVPTLLGVLGFINVGRALRPQYDFFPYVAMFIAYSMGAALVAIFLYGVLGIRLRVERDPVESAMRTAGMGASMLSHSLKNEIGKIKIGAELLDRELNMAEPRLAAEGSAAESLELIRDSADRMLDAVTRIHGQTREMDWREQHCRLDELLLRSVARCSAAAALRGVSLAAGDIRSAAHVSCDPFHLEEALVNVISNGVEAAGPGGTVSASLLRERRKLVVRIADDGPGIAAVHLPYLFLPFYSTKQGRSNYGIGLSYVYQVMKRAGGRVRVSTVEGTGTTLELTMAPSRMPDGKREAGPRNGK
ncbi:Signal transduction histidine kinase [Paenibacillus sp. RU4T]|uniref:sensor histidine kinase n=1 Tax=unclassified Paenibacillus TaxID=185978 RepID=UPI000953BC61|nr:MULTISPECIES: HAMP domain-containing sensor histidine kinase [unclassified Paenibacillus]SIQ30700.1 Signal transduction histidine kinase [Paenibacillus sp. RU4X]SIQ52484.1 Signal transduction histidine kinase [Paenibacillus sp. RU4T]